jgi:hypothetical protein
MSALGRKATLDQDQWFLASNVRFGSLAVVQVNISLMSGFGGKADIKTSEIHEI